MVGGMTGWPLRPWPWTAPFLPCCLGQLCGGTGAGFQQQPHAHLPAALSLHLGCLSRFHPHLSQVTCPPGRARRRQIPPPPPLPFSAQAEFPARGGMGVGGVGEGSERLAPLKWGASPFLPQRAGCSRRAGRLALVPVRFRLPFAGEPALSGPQFLRLCLG